MLWLLVGLMKSPKSSHREAMKKPLLFQDYSDLTSPTGDHIADIDIAVSVVYMTHLRNSFSHMGINNSPF